MCPTQAKSIITKTCLYNSDPLKPHFYIVKLGFTEVYIIFLIFAQNIDCGYLLEPPRRGGSNEYHNLYVLSKIYVLSKSMKNIRVFLSEIFQFLEVKLSIYLNRRVFVMAIVVVSADGTRTRWLSWMRRPTGDQEVAGSTPAEVGNILSWRLIMKYFLRLFSPFRWFKKGSCQFLAKECARCWLTA